MRLNRFLAAAGLGSRRSCEELVESGLVFINGRRVEHLATVVEPGDDVRVRGKVVGPAKPRHILLKKPRGFLSTRSDEKGRRTIYDLLPPSHASLFHIGRLDKESEGLLLLTNDGALSQNLTHPSRGVEKEYEVTLDKEFAPAHADRLLRGITIEGGRGRFERVRILAPKKLAVVLKQGIKRQIRLMLHRLGYEVDRLNRIRIGPLTDRRLQPGAWRELSAAEVAALSASSRPPRPRKPRVRSD
jgi:23S rRNA pseudouridine2605 synthase